MGFPNFKQVFHETIFSESVSNISRVGWTEALEIITPASQIYLLGKMFERMHIHVFY